MHEHALQEPLATPTVADIFIGFLTLGLTAFGGALPLARREIVERRKWLHADEFTDLVGLCQFLPGGNVINLSVAVGMKFRGVAGALAGLLGLIVGPSLIVIALVRAVSAHAQRPAHPSSFRRAVRRSGGLAGIDGREGRVAVAPEIVDGSRRRSRVRGDRVAALAVAAGHARADARVDFYRIEGERRSQPMNHDLVSLAAIFSQLSLLAFGGGNTILPEMQRQVVEVHQWMSKADFSALFALAQAAPGPNMMIVTLVGWHVAGWPGVVVTSIAKFGPSSVVTVAAMHAWERFKHHSWRRYVQLGLVPMTAGLLAASASLIAEASDTRWVLAAITAVVAVLSFKTKLHPLWLLAAGSLIGLSGFGQF